MSAPAETDLIREALSHLPAAAWATTEAAHGQLDALVSELAALRVELQAAERANQEHPYFALLQESRQRAEQAEAALEDAREALREKYDTASTTCSRLLDSPEDDPDGALLDYYEGMRQAFAEAMTVLPARAVLVEGTPDKTQGITYEGLKALHTEMLGDAQGASGGEGSEGSPDG